MEKTITETGIATMEFDSVTRQEFDLLLQDVIRLKRALDDIHETMSPKRAYAPDKVQIVTTHFTGGEPEFGVILDGYYRGWLAQFRRGQWKPVCHSAIVYADIPTPEAAKILPDHSSTTDNPALQPAATRSSGGMLRY